MKTRHLLIAIVLICTAALLLAQNPVPASQKSTSSKAGFEQEIDKKTPAATQSKGRKTTDRNAVSDLYANYSIEDIVFNDRGTPGYIRGDLTPAEAEGNPGDLVFAFLDENRELYDMKSPRAELQIVKTEVDENGFTHVSLSQTYNGIPVHTGELKAHFTPDGRMMSLGSSYWDKIDVPTTPAITAENARQIILEHLMLASDQAQFEDAILVVYPYAQEYYLAWKIAVRAADGMPWRYFADAITGQIVHRVSLIIHENFGQNVDQSTSGGKFVKGKNVAKSVNSPDASPVEVQSLSFVSEQRAIRHELPDPLDQGADNCPATVVSSLPYTDTGTTSGLTNNFTPSCGTSNAADVIYSFTPSVSRTYAISLCGNNGYDTIIDVLSGGNCPGSTSVDCNDDACGSDGLQSDVVVDLTAETTYYIVVDGYDESSGNYTLSIRTNACDIRALTISPSPSPCRVDQWLDIDVNLINDGAISCSGVEVRYYLSADLNFTTSDYYLGSDWITLDVGQTSQQDNSCLLSTLGLTNGSYYVGVMMMNDNSVWYLPTPLVVTTACGYAGSGTGVMGNAQDHIETEFDGANYSMMDKTRRSFTDCSHNHGGSMGNDQQIATYLSSGTFPQGNIAQDADNTSWTPASAVDAHVYAAAYYDYIRTAFNRNGFDGVGSSMLSVVDIASFPDNAFWDPSAERIGFGTVSAGHRSMAGAPDIVGHEWSHAITGHESNLEYEGESGALNESFSDMIGAAFGFVSGLDADWQNGENFNTNGEALRDLADPPSITNGCDGQPYPDTYLGTGWHDVTNCQPAPGCPPDGNDYCWVHINSSVANKMFYLLSQGGTHNGVTVQGITVTNAAQVVYRANRDFWLSTSNFSQARQGCIDAAEALGHPVDWACQVRLAWAAVGVGDACCPPPQVQGVFATDNDCNRIQVTWFDVASEEYYQLFRDGSQIGGDLPANTTSYEDFVATPSIPHSYTVQACNGASCCGELSFSDIGTLLLTPAQVTGVVASDERCNDVLITWNDVEHETLYRIYRNGMIIASNVPANSTSYIDNTGVAGTFYDYAIQACNITCCGNTSLVDAGASSPIPTTPAGLVAPASNEYICADDFILYQWQAAPDPHQIVVGYHLELSLNGNFGNHDPNVYRSYMTTETQQLVQLSPTEIPRGNWFWRVAAVSECDLESTPTQPWFVHVNDVPSISQAAPEDCIANCSNSSLRFSWVYDPENAADYWVRFYEEGQQTPYHSIQWSAYGGFVENGLAYVDYTRTTDGNMQWRVFGLDPCFGHNESQFATTRTVYYNPVLPLPCNDHSLLLFPEWNIYLCPGVPGHIFAWSEVPFADDYVFEWSFDEINWTMDPNSYWSDHGYTYHTRPDGHSFPCLNDYVGAYSNGNKWWRVRAIKQCGGNDILGSAPPYEYDSRTSYGSGNVQIIETPWFPNESGYPVCEDVPFQFKWHFDRAYINDVSRFDLQFAHNQQFNNPVWSYNTGTNDTFYYHTFEFDHSVPANNVWYWRVIPQYRCGPYGTWFQGWDMNIEVQPQPEAQNLVAPENGDVFCAGAPVTFNWAGPHTYVDSYIFEYSNNEDFFDQNPGHPEWETESVPVAAPPYQRQFTTAWTGTVYWRVYSVNAECGSVVSNGMPRTIRIWVPPAAPNLYDPAEGEFVCMLNSPQSVHFSWSDRPMAERYRLLAENVENPAHQFDIMVTEDADPSDVDIDYQLNLDASGEWVWRVIPENDCGIGAASGIVLFTLLSNPGIPQLLSPAPSEAYCVGEPITFRWGPPANPLGQIIYLFRAELDGQTPIESYGYFEEPDGTFSIPVALPVAGNWTWKIRAENQCDLVSQWASRPVVAHTEPTLTPLFLYPPDGASICPDQQNHVTIDWTDVPDADQYHIFLNHSTWQIPRNEWTTESQWLISNPEPGTYIYRVTAHNECGSLQYALRTFEIDAPLMSAPGTLTPENGAIVPYGVEQEFCAQLVPFDATEFEFEWSFFWDGIWLPGSEINVESPEACYTIALAPEGFEENLQWRWRMRAWNCYGGPWSDYQYFTLQYGSLLEDLSYAGCENDGYRFEVLAYNRPYSEEFPIEKVNFTYRCVPRGQTPGEWTTTEAGYQVDAQDPTWEVHMSLDEAGEGGYVEYIWWNENYLQQIGTSPEGADVESPGDGPTHVLYYDEAITRMRPCVEAWDPGGLPEIDEGERLFIWPHPGISPRTFALPSGFSHDLSVVGTETTPITVTAEDGFGSLSFCAQNTIFDQMSETVNVDGGVIQLESCTFTETTGAIVCSQTETSSSYLRNCTFHNTVNEAAVIIVGGDLIVENCRFENSSGLYMEYAGETELSNCQFTSSGTSGLIATAGCGSVRMQCCTFMNNGGSGYPEVLDDESDLMLNFFARNTFSDDGILYYLSGNPDEIKFLEGQNSFILNSGAGYYIATQGHCEEWEHDLMMSDNYWSHGAYIELIEPPGECYNFGQPLTAPFECGGGTMLQAEEGNLDPDRQARAAGLLSAIERTSADAQHARRLQLKAMAKNGTPQAAIDDFEEIMRSSPSRRDSVRAALDAAYTYLRHQNEGVTTRNSKLKVRTLGEYGRLAVSSLLELYRTAALETAELQPEAEALPRSYHLYQNHPNPFNAITEIRFDLPEAADVKVKVFNTLGQEVATVVDKTLSAGSHRVLWNSVDAVGKTTASGVYIYQIQAGDFVDAKKMVLIR